MRVISPPYKTVTSAVVQASPWIDAGTGEPFPEAGLGGWDPTVDLRLRRSMTIHDTTIRREAGLGGTASIACVVAWRSPETTLRGPAWRAGVEGDGTVVAEIEVPGSMIGDRVELTTQIVLRRGGPGDARLAARTSGSVLWSDVAMLRVAGDGGRFPMEWLDFAAAGWLPEGAAWYLEWSPDQPEMPAMGSIRLYLNSGHPPLCEALAANPPLAQHRALREALRYDVARQLILGAIGADEETWDAAASDPESTAAAVNRLMRMTFPHESLSSLRLRRSEPLARLEARLQAGLRAYRM